MGNRLDNLIPLRGRINANQYAGWKPDGLADSGLGCRIQANVMIPVSPDGTRLSADIYFPRQPGRYPAIVQMAAYNKEMHTAGVPTGTNEIGSPPIFTGRGYIQVVLSRRGMGRSDGQPAPFLMEQEIDDYCACIEWAAAQSWCSGDVLMFGTSYYAMVQPIVAARQPKGLRGFFANEICTDFFRHLTHYAGTPNHAFFGLWVGANFKDADFVRQMSPLRRAIMSQIINRKWLWNRVIHQKIRQIYSSFIDKEPAEVAKHWFADTLFVQKSRGQGAISAGSYKMLQDIKVPFVVVQNQGMFNLHQFGSYDLFQNAGTPKDKRFLVIGEHEYELPVLSWQLEALAFFDWLVKGQSNGYDRQARVRYWSESEGKYRSASDFPVPGATRKRFHLHSAGADGELHGLAPEPDQSGSNQWIAIPLGTHLLKGVETVITQQLSYRGGFAEPAVLAGPVTLNLNFSSNEIDSFIVARLGRLDAAGGFHFLAIGAVSPARSAIDRDLATACEIVHKIDQPVPLVPYQAREIRFSLTPATTVFQAGDQLVLDIASRTDLLKMDIAEGYVHMDLQVPPYFSQNSLHYGPQTYLELDFL